MLATEIPGEAVAAVLTVLTLIGVGLTSWLLATMFRLSNVIAALEAKLMDHDKRLDRLDRFIDSGHPEHRQ
jgi:hypothetical protein